MVACAVSGGGCDGEGGEGRRTLRTNFRTLLQLCLSPGKRNMVSKALLSGTSLENLRRNEGLQWYCARRSPRR